MSWRHPQTAVRAVPASPDTGVNTVTGEGLTEALQGASVVIDVSKSPSFENTAVLDRLPAIAISISKTS
jgi:hypothetical protein